jgi:long-chain acyl-CoA synthetase
VHAADVEAVLYRHPAVAEAAVAAVPHEVLGEEVGAWVVRRSGRELSADDVMAFCREHLTDFKCPRVVTFVDELPRNPTGKVLKRDLPPATA